MALEALRTQIDALKWDKCQLEAENRKLKAAHPDQATLVELEAELIRSKEETAHLTERLGEVPKLEQQLTEALQQMDEFRRQTEEAGPQGDEERRLQQALQDAEGRATAAEDKVKDLETRLEQESQYRQTLEERCKQQEDRSEQLLRDAELRQYKLLETERQKWEGREERLLEQLRTAQAQFEAAKEGSGEPTKVLEAQLRHEQEIAELRESNKRELEDERLKAEELQAQAKLLQAQLNRVQGTVDRNRAVSSSGPLAEDVEHTARVDPPTPLTPRSRALTEARAGSATDVVQQTTAVEEAERSGLNAAMQISQALLTQQLPPIPKFTGEDQSPGSETFQEWREQFEMVAGLGGWDHQAKLVNLTTRLRGQAYSFYRSCSLQQRASYDLLVEELKFTPVQIQAVQSSLFHERRQKPRESVDDYAQDLRRLFYKAYPKVQLGTQEAADIGKSVLANQFVTGLLPELKTKLAGKEGDFDELLVRARFEEARLRDLADSVQTQRNVGKKPPEQLGHMMTPHGQDPLRRNPSRQKGQYTSPGFGGKPRNSGEPTCYSCGATGHLARNFRWQRSYGQEEARGRNWQRSYGQEDTRGRNWQPPKNQPGHHVAAVVPIGEGKKTGALTGKGEAISQSQPDDGVPQALSKYAARMHGLSQPSQEMNLGLGPTLTTDIELEGTPVKALVDTGSPVTIVSLDAILNVLSATKSATQTAEEWKTEVNKRLEPSTVVLHNYGGDQLNLVRQIKVTVSKAGRGVDTVVQVQRDAPVGLLLGTDLLSQLGFALLEANQDGEAFDLFHDRKWTMVRDNPESAEQGPSLELREQSETRVSGQPENSSPHETEGLIQDTRTDLTLEHQGTQKDGSTETPQGVVRLLQAVRIPARHQKLLRAKIEGLRGHSTAVFEPEPDLAKQMGLSMPESLVEPDGNQWVTLTMENSSFEPTRLMKGRELGRVYPADVVPSEPRMTDGTELAGQAVAHMHHGLPAPDRINLEVPVECEVEPLITIQQNEKLLNMLQIGSDHLTKEQMQHLKTFLCEYRDVFALDNTELGTTDLVTHPINTGDQPPIRQQVRRTPFALREEVNNMVQDMLERGIIRPSRSPWASPIVLVKKKDGTTRFCVDYRRLNAITKLDVFPLPRIDDTLDLLSKVQYFTTLDLASGYWQVEMDPEDLEKTAFITYSGLYEFNVMPFGLCNAPATFQRLMENVLAGLTCDCCMVYIDDILVTSKTFEDHLLHLGKVLDRLCKAGLRLKPTKCNFAQEKVDYLGHVVSKYGVEVDPRKVEAVRDFAQPHDLITLRSFLGLAAYYRRFIPNFSKVASPLHALTRKDTPFVWTPTCQNAFDELKQLLTKAPVLAFPDFTRDFLLETDASGVGLGAVLAQKQEDGAVRPLAFASRTLQPHEKNYGVTELEALGVVWAAKHFRPYLYGHHCDVYTDHEALKSLLNTPQPSGKLARWGMALQ